MIIGERFVWAHLPKTAGDAAAAMFRAVPGLVRFADPPQSEDKHLPFFAREAELAGRLRAMNLRRLPSWTLSAAHHRARHGVHPEYRPMPLETAEEMTRKTDPDDLLVWMTDHDRLAVERWLRAEFLEEDVLAFLDELGQLTPAAAAGVRAVGRVNAGSYERDLRRWFTAEQVQQLYERNPRWAAIERRLYGDLITLD
jgi:hypothetical protein